jgi:hypothetical protein
MKSVRFLPLALFAILLPLLTAGPADNFAKWWPTFQAAVAKGDAKAVAQNTRFPLSWENGPIREIKTEAEFVNGFDKYFTGEIRKAVATGKPDVLPDGTYIITWKARGNEYSLYFKPQGSAFMLDALSEGPA